MSTRGLYGLRKNGIDKTFYHHCDSYPDYLGYNIAEFIRETSIEELHQIYDGIILVGETSKVYPDQLQWCLDARIINLNLGTQSTNDWYCLLRDLQGNLPMVKKLVKETGKCYMMDDHEFILDSLYCEYGYIINLDDETLEFFKGFQGRADTNNRYGTDMLNGYYPCKIILAIPLREITNADDVVNQMINAGKKNQ